MQRHQNYAKYHQKHSTAKYRNDPSSFFDYTKEYIIQNKQLKEFVNSIQFIIMIPLISNLDHNLITF